MFRATDSVFDRYAKFPIYDPFNIEPLIQQPSYPVHCRVFMLAIVCSVGCHQRSGYVDRVGKTIDNELSERVGKSEVSK